MLLQFNFKNFKSFRDETVLDMAATGISEFTDHVEEVGKERVLPVAAVYGANAGGKSNLIDALRYMSTFVIQSLHYGNTVKKNREVSEYLKPTPYLLDEKSKQASSDFEVFFLAKENNKLESFNYGFRVSHNGVEEEWLGKKGVTSLKDYRPIFHRRNSEIEFSKGFPKSQQDNVQIALEDETLVISLGAKLKIKQFQVVYNWFYNQEFANFGRPIENHALSQRLPRNFVEDEAVQQQVVDYLSTFDSSIKGFEVEVMELADEKNNPKVRIDAIHRMNDSDQTTTIPLKLESSGTLKMFALYPMLQEVLDTGSILFADELNAQLHPLLVRNLIITFLSKKTNPKRAQLIFTTHDSWLLDSGILRRDEIWFTEKMEDGATSLFSLADFVDNGVKIRKDENYMNNYLFGKYGAIPELTQIQAVSERMND